MKNETLSFVIPVKDEDESLPLLIQALKTVTLRHNLSVAEIILVDDGSTDNSWSVIKSLASEEPLLKALRLRRNFGKATALMVGIEAATGDIIITMDADLQDDPEEVPAMLAKMAEGYDLVSGWKKVRNDPPGKTIPSRLFNKVTAWMSGVNLHDFNCGFKAYRREIFDSVQLYGELHRYIPVLAHAVGYRVGEMVVRHHARKYGRSKYGFARFLRGFLDLLTVLMITRYAYRPGHLFGGVGAAFLVTGGGILTYLSGLKILTGASIGERPLLMLGVMLVIISIHFLLFGMLSELIINRSPSPVSLSNLVMRRVGFRPKAEVQGNKTES